MLVGREKSEEGRDRDGVCGTSGTPTRFPPVCGCVVWAGKAAARHMAHPRQRPGHKRGRRKRYRFKSQKRVGSVFLRKYQNQIAVTGVGKLGSRSHFFWHFVRCVQRAWFFGLTLLPHTDKPINCIG